MPPGHRADSHGYRLSHRERLLPDLLAAAAVDRPDSPAVRGRTEEWSYLRLDAAASRVAVALRDSGIREGDRVCVCARKEPETIAALFGILRAGAVFVPLDRSAPLARLAKIAADSGARALIGEGNKFRELPGSLSEGESFELIVETAPAEKASSARPMPGEARRLSWEEVLAAPAARVATTRGARDLAYILYTSGSTGTPKGVMISHENALAFTSWARAKFDVGPSDRVTSVAPLHFDLSTFDVYSTIEAGGTILLVPEEIALFPASLSGFLESSKATVTYLVPSAITAMITKGDLAGRDLSILRLVLFAGEVFPINHLARFIELLPSARMANLYGPTETNVCTWYDVKPGDRTRLAPVPIGIGSSGDTTFAVTDDGDLVRGPGVEGELHVAGPTVALGYWGDPEKTARLFLETHPMAPSGSRVYRTGDRVSLDEEGNWIFHGRRDHMVKSRGFRIELGEIEAALHAHPAVAEAVAVAIPNPEIGSWIKACVVLRAGHAADGPAIQRHCGERLARYMVPELVEFFPAFPLTSSGKVDRLKLAATGESVPPA